MAAPELDVPWSDGRQDVETRKPIMRTGRAAFITTTRTIAQRWGVSRRVGRGQWSDEAILTAIQDYHARANRWPGQHDFRSANRLTGFGTVRRRYGSQVQAVRAAEKRPAKAATPSPAQPSSAQA